MLILTRKVGEKLIIGDDISITTLNIKGNQVRLGIDAPRELTIRRDEIEMPPELNSPEAVPEKYQSM